MIKPDKYTHILVLNLDKNDRLLSTDRFRLNDCPMNSLKTTLDDKRIHYSKLIKVFIPDARTEDTWSLNPVQRELQFAGSSAVG